MQTPRTIQWVGDTNGFVRLIDQTLLPTTLQYRDCRSVAEVWEAIRSLRVSAGPGYAVGAMKLRTSIGINGMSLTFMRIKGERLDPQQSYASAWIGSDTSAITSCASSMPGPPQASRLRRVMAWIAPHWRGLTWLSTAEWD